MDTGVQAVTSDSYYFTGDSVEDLNQLSLNPNCKKIVFDQDVELTVDQTIKIQKGQIIIGNGAIITRDSEFKNRMIQLYDGVDFSGFRIDGSNIIDGTWDETIDLVASSNCNIHDCEFYNSNETIVAYGKNITIGNCSITGANGNGIHLSDCSSSIIRNNYVKDTNLSESYTNGQAGIYVCQDVYDVLIDGNYVENSKNGIGKLDSIKNQNIVITNNNICRSREYGLYGIYHTSDEKLTAKNLLITNNVFSDCKFVTFRNNYDNSVLSDLELTFSNNILIDTSLVLASNKNALITNNRIINGHIELLYTNSATISNNYIQSEIYGIYGQKVTNIRVNCNIVESTTLGIVFKTDSNTNFIVDNTLTITTETSYSIEGIYAGENSTILSNVIYLNGGTGIIGHDNSIITSNIVIGLADEVIAIRVYGGSSNIIVKNNIANNSSFVLATSGTCVYEDNLLITD